MRGSACYAYGFTDSAIERIHLVVVDSRLGDRLEASLQ